ncbi:recombinase family protein [Curtobacterium sp. 24E2]
MVASTLIPDYRTLDQSNVRQLDGVALDRVFDDKASGKDGIRPQLEVRIGFVRDGDTVLVHSMDRLARSPGDLRRIVRRLTDKVVCVESVEEHLTFTGVDSALANLLPNLRNGSAVRCRTNASGSRSAPETHVLRPTVGRPAPARGRTIEA